MDVNDSQKDKIRQNYLYVVDQINKAASKSRRDPADIRLMVVTKTHPVEIIRSLINWGVTDFGENYLQEAITKIDDLRQQSQIRWHMIGHVQSRKAKDVCRYFHYLHSLDGVELAEKLSKFASMQGKILPVYLEFNTSGVESKSGWDIAVEGNWKNIIPDLERIFVLPHLEFLGVMTIPEYSTNPEDSRPVYRKLRKFQKYVIDYFSLSGFRELSIGMSADYEIAIEEGSTCLRIGQAILGPRKG